MICWKGWSKSCEEAYGPRTLSLTEEDSNDLAWRKRCIWSERSTSRQQSV
jgi:hypothetical protein